MKILAPVCDRPVQSGKVLSGLSPVVAAPLLPAESAACFCKLLDSLLEWLGSRLFPSIADGEKTLQAEVHARYFGSRGMEGLMLGIGDEDEDNVPQGIPLDGEGFDFPLDLTGLEKPVLLLADPQSVAGQRIAGLLQGETSVFIPLAEGGRLDFPSRLLIYILEEQLVAFFDSLHHVLYGLGANLRPERIAWNTLQLGDVLHQLELV